MAMVLACASMLFSTNSAIALSGLLCENAMIRIAFQSSPIRNLPLSDSFDFAALIFATMIRNFDATAREGRPLFACQQPLTIPTVLAGRQDWRGCGLEMTLYPGDSRERDISSTTRWAARYSIFCVDQGSLPQSFRPKSSCVYFSPFCFSLYGLNVCHVL